MSDTQLKAIVSAEIARAIGYMGSSTVATEREKALDYYYGRPFGNEIDGRSQVVSTDVADVIESVMPSLMKIFAATDDVAKFEPRGQEDEQAAQQATEYVNYVFYSDNPGFLILHDWFKDALMQKLGAVKAWWDESERIEEKTFTGLTDDDMASIMQEEGVEAIEHTETQSMALGPDGNPVPMMLHELKIKRTVKDGRIKVMGIPPEETLVSPASRSREDARLIGHRVRTTRSKLVAQGYDRKAVDDIPVGDDTITDEGHARIEDEGANLTDSGTSQSDKASDIVYVNECFIQIDYDGDGKAELRRVVSAGPTGGEQILENDPADECDIYLLTPIRVPHKIIGQALADLVMDLQLIKSTLQRNLLDNAYLNNNPRMTVLEGQANLDDLLTNRPGGLVRIKSPNAVTPLIVPSQLAPVLNSIEYFDSVREVRTGVTRYNQGLDANSLNKTATGVNAVMNAAQQRIELIARIFAETGVKDLFRGILKKIVRHQDKERMIRLRGRFVPIDPRSWNADMDMSVAVGLGTGNRDQLMQHMMLLLQVQEKAAMASGGALVSSQNFFNSFQKLIEAIGLKGVETYFVDPSKAQQQQGQKSPSPEEIKAQVAQQQAQTDMQMKQLDMQLAEAKHGMEMQKMQREAERDMLNHQIAMQQMQMKAAQMMQQPMGVQ